MAGRAWTGSDWSWFPRQPTVAQKRARAVAAASRLARATRSGDAPEPIKLDGHKIAATFWGKAWCRNLESYSDFSNRLPRGRSYLRAGAVVDLKIAPGKVLARVAGSRLYEVEISIRALAPEIWRSVAARCSGRIDSMVALLQGRIPDEVMRVVTDPEQGLFPRDRQIAMTCSCPDWAGMCKHVAASLYGVGARLDRRPELLFVLRGVDPADLVHAAAGQVTAGGDAGAEADLGGADLGQMFGIELAAPAPNPPPGGPGSAPKAQARVASPRRAGRGRSAVPVTAKPKAKAKPASKAEPPPEPKRRRRPGLAGQRGRAKPSPLAEFLSQLAQLGRVVRPLGRRTKRR
jgi:uncharacterized Zn finger protein